MKRGLRITAFAVVVLLVVTLITLRVVGVPPKDQRPGLWLTGAVVTEPLNDWSFTDAVPEVQVQTRSWYLIPHSVTTQCVKLDGQLYLASFHFGGPRRLWNRNVARDPRVRIKIGDRLFDRKMVPLTNGPETERVFQAYIEKYPSWRAVSERPESQRPEIFYWRTEPL
jgi:hypothetical protein